MNWLVTNGLQAGMPVLDFGGIHGKEKQRHVAAIHAAMGREYRPAPAWRLFVPELDRYLRVVTLEDGVTLHNAFPDRRFKPCDSLTTQKRILYIST
jgi:hypothetical protein